MFRVLQLNKQWGKSRLYRLEGNQVLNQSMKGGKNKAEKTIALCKASFLSESVSSNFEDIPWHW